jgi:uncharacterized protein (DUF1778 family)
MLNNKDTKNLPDVATLDDAQWAAFTATLEVAPKPRPRLKRLLNEPTILD